MRLILIKKKIKAFTFDILDLFFFPSLVEALTSVLDVFFFLVKGNDNFVHFIYY